MSRDESPHSPEAQLEQDCSPELDCAPEPGTEPTRPLRVQPRIEPELRAGSSSHEPPALMRRSSDTLLPPAPDETEEQAPNSSSAPHVSKFGTIPPGGIGVACRTNLNRYPSAPPSIRPSVATVPPRGRSKDDSSVLASVFWGALAIAFGASVGAVCWELTEEPARRHSAFERAPAQTKSFANMPPMERRRADRVSEWLPVQLDAGKAGLAVTHNVSETGALLVTAQVLEVGQLVTIKASLPASGDALERDIALEARVVRFSANTEDPEGLWPYSVAVQFEKPHPELEAALRELAP